MEALALLSLVVPGLVSPLLELVGAVSERALVVVLTRTCLLPEFANLGLEFHLEALFTRWLLNRSICSGLLSSFLLLSVFL